MWQVLPLLEAWICRLRGAVRDRYSLVGMPFTWIVTKGVLTRAAVCVSRVKC
ncbi:protein kinase-like domain-containing protein [Colletotrichum graminicola]|nr:protein kinase-like domain-containing protein [Colletotrichum graminicola]